MSPGNALVPAPSRRLARLADAELERPIAPLSAPPPRAKPRWSRRRGVLGAFAAFAAVAFVGAYVGPMAVAFGPEPVAATSLFATAVDGAQSIDPVAEGSEFTLDRDSYTVYVKPKPKPKPKQASAGGGLPVHYTGGGSKTEWLTAAGIAQSDWGYVDYIVQRESGWNPNATNSSSGACGLVQALPCSKVPGNGYNPVDNLRWANGYAKGRYGSWAGAYQFWINNHWW